MRRLSGEARFLARLLRGSINPNKKQFIHLHRRRLRTMREHRSPAGESGRIANFNQIKPFGWGGRAAGAAVAGRECAGDIVGPPASEPDQFERAGHIADLVMQERARPCLDMDLLADSTELEPIQGLDRRFCLAQ